MYKINTVLLMLRPSCLQLVSCRAWCRLAPHNFLLLMFLMLQLAADALEFLFAGGGSGCGGSPGGSTLLQQGAAAGLADLHHHALLQQQQLQLQLDNAAQAGAGTGHGAGQAKGKGKRQGAGATKKQAGRGRARGRGRGRSSAERQEQAAEQGLVPQAGAAKPRGKGKGSGKSAGSAAQVVEQPVVVPVEAVQEDPISSEEEVSERPGAATIARAARRRPRTGPARLAAARPIPLPFSPMQDTQLDALLPPPSRVSGPGTTLAAAFEDAAALHLPEQQHAPSDAQAPAGADADGIQAGAGAGAAEAHAPEAVEPQAAGPMEVDDEPQFIPCTLEAPAAGDHAPAAGEGGDAAQQPQPTVPHTEAAAARKGVKRSGPESSTRDMSPAKGSGLQRAGKRARTGTASSSVPAADKLDQQEEQPPPQPHTVQVVHVKQEPGAEADGTGVPEAPSPQPQPQPASAPPARKHARKPVQPSRAGPDALNVAPFAQTDRQASGPAVTASEQPQGTPGTPLAAPHSGAAPQHEPRANNKRGRGRMSSASTTAGLPPRSDLKVESSSQGAAGPLLESARRKHRMLPHDVRVLFSSSYQPHTLKKLAKKVVELGGVVVGDVEGEGSGSQLGAHGSGVAAGSGGSSKRRSGGAVPPPKRANSPCVQGAHLPAFTHFVCPSDKFVRSMKQLVAIACGAALVTDGWLDASFSSGMFLEPQKDHMSVDAAAERKYKFNLWNSYCTRKQLVGGLLAGRFGVLLHWHGVSLRLLQHLDWCLVLFERS